ncbi:DUF4382 domain-containing protein [Winogradskyella echinorum]|uniref:DUF4382 domain-containing protein n=1 Tax=Winogradskyella echinorum TaxID=538189 RepID=A0ABR6XZQ4_9FLAO|nr:DUF4382 domain-containing protein [Winogradskyella echinorum]MBC3845955.1 DUF4382 domain-containing protein [Winogradskyella echinorum]MBC5750303.1 DUF4382 domain-containing protein [Winogradskyella echinorum]
MKRLQSLKFLFFSVIFIACFASCTPDETYSRTEVSNISVKLKSTIGDLNKVYVEIEDVQLKVKEDDNATNAWISLNAVNTGTYNIFDFREHSELELVDNFEIESTYIYEIRLVLGDNSFIDLNNTLYSLDILNLGNAIPSNLVKIELLPNRLYDFIINIDIDESVSFNEDENMMVLNPKLYTEIRQLRY